MGSERCCCGIQALAAVLSGAESLNRLTGLFEPDSGAGDAVASGSNNLCRRVFPVETATIRPAIFLAVYEAGVLGLIGRGKL